MGEARDFLEKSAKYYLALNSARESRAPNQGLGHDFLDCCTFLVCDDLKLFDRLLVERIQWKETPRKVDHLRRLFFINGEWLTFAQI